MSSGARWLAWAQQLQAIAQTGLTYAKDPYDLERYRQLRELAVEIAADHLVASREQVSAAFALGSGYPTPKLDVRAVVFQGEEILLVRERAVAKWSLPGGWADVGQSLGEVAARETLEESGYEVRPVKLLAVLDKARHAHPPSLDYAYKCFLSCRLEGGEARTSHETDAVGFFAAQALPELDDHRVTRAQLARMFEHRADPSLPADFD
jgi:ADP-ribose pyrophosphatase YjhB (NUDIX family)